MLRMKIKSYILVILFSLSFAACEKEDNNGPKTDNDVNLWIEKTMRDNYLWNSELPEKNTLNFNADPKDFFHSYPIKMGKTWREAIIISRLLKK